MQTTVPGFNEWREDEQRYLATLERDRMTLALRGALQPKGRGRRDELPLFDEREKGLFEEE